jgi:hypothetical protein
MSEREDRASSARNPGPRQQATRTKTRSWQCAFGGWSRLAGFLLVVGLAGCGKGLYHVKGQVVYKDGSDVSVLAGGKVLFDPANEEMEKVSARGEIQSDGSFAMSTYQNGDGVKPGKYRVMVAPPPFFAKRRGQERPRLLDERFQNFATSDLEITVTGSTDDYTVTVQKP